MFCFSIVRNKAAEKAKHVHHHQTHHVSQSLSGGPVTTESLDGSTGTNGDPQAPCGTSTSNGSTNSANTNSATTTIPLGPVPTNSTTDLTQAPTRQLNNNGNAILNHSAPEQRTAGYSINGILGLQQDHLSHNTNNMNSANNNGTDPNCKRKRIEVHGKFLIHFQIFFLLYYRFFKIEIYFTILETLFLPNKG